jgi:biopolymer transport protein ExbD
VKIGRLVVIIVAACQSAKPDDCKVVLADPPHAMAEITRRHPHDPVKVAETIERCLAPRGNPCERIATVAKAIPGMMPGAALPSGSGVDYLAVCRGMPPAMQHCMLPSYLLGHQAECKQILDQIAHAIDIKPSTKPSTCEAGTIVVYLDDDGVWLATGTGPAARCFAARDKDDEFDGAWLEAELRPFVSGCAPDVELSSAPDVAYADAIRAMDIAVKVGLVDIGLSEPDQAAVSFAGADHAHAAAHCPQTTIRHHDDVASAAPPPSTPSTPASGTDGLKDAPVVIITRDAVRLGDKPVGTIAELTIGSGSIAALAKLLPPHPANPILILQADQATDMNVILRVIDTAKAAGFPNVLFAVKNH